eukprot:gene11078-23159_t
MNRSALLTVGQTINGDKYLTTVLDYEPSGLIINAYNQNDSTEYQLTITEVELAMAGFSRKEESLKRLIDSLYLAPQGNGFALQSLNPMIRVQKGLPSDEDLEVMIKTSQEGVPSIHDLLVTGLVELCKVKPVGIDAVKWLGEWLLANNPNKPRIEGPDDE